MRRFTKIVGASGDKWTARRNTCCLAAIIMTVYCRAAGQIIEAARGPGAKPSAER